jgi:predicted RNase H-like nuclease
VLGADLPREWQGGGSGEGTIVLLDEVGSVQTLRPVETLTQVAQSIGELAAGEPFLAGVNLPVIVPEKEARFRPVENLIRRRLGHRIPPGGRAALVPGRGGVAGETLLAALSAAGHPSLPYPDRDRLNSGLVEIHASLVLKVLMWEGSPLARGTGPQDHEELFRAYRTPEYRSPATSRVSWAERMATIDLVLRVLGPMDGIDLRPAREALLTAASEPEVDRSASILDATLIAAAARRYLEQPEACVFLGDRKDGYAVLPADAFVRRLALRESSRPSRAHLFPRASLRERLGEAAELRPLDLLPVPGRPQLLEAVFKEAPLHEFDNLDEMLWWKHCRQLAGPELPVEGLKEMVVALGHGKTEKTDHEAHLRLVRSRHRTLSFRFEPPRSWRVHVPTRDGKTYPFRVLRAVYETRPSGN